MTTAGSSAVRDRILGVARRRFYAEGIKAVSADQLISDAAIAKVTFYRHFPSKDDLVEAYLSAESREEQELVERQRRLHPDDPVAVLTWYARSIGKFICAPGFRGCPFINAAAEYPASGHPARQVVETHRSWLHATARDLIAQLGVLEPDNTADMLIMLRDGAMVSGYLGDQADRVAARLLTAGRAVLFQAGARLAR